MDRAIDYSGMTVNERLFVSGLLPAFDKAKKSNDKESIIKILKQVRIDEASINAILQQLNLS